ncbi:hypothetical protein NPX13_g79 [Xylaria arbuscula]|uniref:PA14 domain-containing protein n=1 Tax=Xylaria arbuscula TaxID=114810 RepID=A0A9W8NNW4_9PEZI|nr:hypothetical protein NPX13_g79 [Xylaria arbuscula]
MITFTRPALFGAAFFVYSATCERPTSTVKTTVPWTGTYATSTTVTPCVGPATVLIETPIESSTCAPSATPIKPAPCETYPGCSPAGLNIEYFTNPVGGFGTGDTPPSYYITEGLSPLAVSLTNVTYFAQDAPPADTTNGWTRSTNGGLTVNANNFTLVYYGFYRAPSTGIFTICTSSDNENDVFFGRNNAFSCDDGKPSPNANPLHVSRGGSYMNPINCTDVSLIEGRYYPVRSVLGNYGGPSAFNFTIWEPNVSFEDRKNDFTGSVYPLSCGWLTNARNRNVSRHE